jgi:hypothetical protein
MSKIGSVEEMSSFLENKDFFRSDDQNISEIQLLFREILERKKVKKQKLIGVDPSIPIIISLEEKQRNELYSLLLPAREGEDGIRKIEHRPLNSEKLKEILDLYEKTSLDCLLEFQQRFRKSEDGQRKGEEILREEVGDVLENVVSKVEKISRLDGKSSLGEERVP